MTKAAEHELKYPPFEKNNKKTKTKKKYQKKQMYVYRSVALSFELASFLVCHSNRRNQTMFKKYQPSEGRKIG